jgi:putative transposase
VPGGSTVVVEWTSSPRRGGIAGAPQGLSGLVRGGKHRTTVSTGQDGRRAPDLLDRDFTAAAPNRKWVTDFTYCRTWSGFVYVAFVIDCFSRAIVGWHAPHR